MLVLIWRLWGHVRPLRRRQLALVLALMALASLAELTAVALVVPFMALLSDPANAANSSLARRLSALTHLTDPVELLLAFSGVFVASTILAAVGRLLVLHRSTRLSFAIGSDLNADIYRRTLHQPYRVHIARNSSEVIDGITTKTWAVLFSTLMPALLIVSSLLMLVAFLVPLLVVDPWIALAAFAGFGLSYVGIAWYARGHLSRGGAIAAKKSTEAMRVLQEGLGGIRDVLLDGTQNTYCEAYASADRELRRVQASLTFIAQSPRFILEALGMAMIAGLACMLARRPGGLTETLPVLALLALGAQRLLPVLQQAYSAWASMRGGAAALKDALDLLDQPLAEDGGLPAPDPLRFERSIELRGVSFRYSPEAPHVLQDIDLVIPRGARVGFIGPTGSGKSTLLDIVMGLLEPSEGVLAVDGLIIGSDSVRSWQVHVAHVPQSIFLADASILENIALGVPLDRIDPDRVRRAAEQACIDEVVRHWTGGYGTRAGERGVRLSGGQRQRIGIARALYRRTDVIVFDEATSALDGETEADVMQAIRSLGRELTVLIIAHRLSTLRGCDMVVELGRDGRIVRTLHGSEVPA